MLTVSLTVGLIAAVSAICLAGGFTYYGWDYYSPLKWNLMHVSAAVALFSSVVFAWLMANALQETESGRGAPVGVLTIVMIVFNAIIWHDLWGARRKLAQTHTVATAPTDERSLNER